MRGLHFFMIAGPSRGEGRRRATVALWVTCLSVLLASPVNGQRLAVGNADEAYLRVLQTLGRAPTEASMLIRPLSMHDALNPSVDSAGHPWAGRWGATFRSTHGSLYIHDPEVLTIFQSQFPESRNEGALTPGRYLTTTARVGASLRQGPLTVSLRPMVAWVQNGDFPLAPVELSGQPEYAYPWRRMDAPQRFGPDPYYQVDWGQSEVRLALGPVSTSFGTTNLWWGPGVQNAILMSNNAAGFPHASLETSRPVDIGIGRLEAQWIFGRLQGTDWFDPSIEDRGRYVTGAVATLSPDGPLLKGLSLGAARVFYANVPEGGIPLGEYLLVFQTPIKSSLQTPDSPKGDDERDQLFSLFARWVFPESGFEVYGEWARNDHSDRLVDYFVVLGNTAAFTVGLQRATELAGGEVLVLNAELTQLDNPADVRAYLAGPVYYSHGLVPRGYTNRGQVVGASIGPGGTTQHLGAELYAPWGRAATYVQRRLLDKDAWLNRKASGQDITMDAQLSVGGEVTWFRGAWDINASAEGSRRFNRYFAPSDDTHNIRLTLGARLRLGWAEER